MKSATMSRLSKLVYITLTFGALSFMPHASLAQNKAVSPPNVSNANMSIKPSTPSNSASSASVPTLPTQSADRKALNQISEGEKEEELQAPGNTNFSTFDDLDKQFLEPERKKVFIELYASYDVRYTFRREDKLALLDIYYPPEELRVPNHLTTGSPLLILVHGGAWIGGDKSYASVIENKVAHYTQKGFIVASVNYRLLPQVDLAEQIRDVGRAIGYLQKNSDNIGSNNKKMIVMGHSSGAHIVSLLSVNSKFRQRTEARPWAASILLDNVAYNVESVMRRPHGRYFDRAFGGDPKNWSTYSPQQNLTESAVPLLLVSSTRPNSENEARQFVLEAQKKNISAQGVSVNLNHVEVNDKLGLPSSYTQTVDNFIEEALKDK